VVPGVPVPCARARTYRDARKGRMRTVTPTRTRSYESLVRDVAQLTANKEGWRIVSGDVYEVWLGIYREARHGDWDNYAKATCDAMQGIVYRNDRAIEDSHVRLRIDAECPRVEVTVEAFMPERSGT